jgi:hypothetical protein
MHCSLNQRVPSGDLKPRSKVALVTNRYSVWDRTAKIKKSSDDVNLVGDLRAHAWLQIPPGDRECPNLAAAYWVASGGPTPSGKQLFAEGGLGEIAAHAGGGGRLIQKDIRCADSQSALKSVH